MESNRRSVATRFAVIPRFHTRSQNCGNVLPHFGGPIPVWRRSDAHEEVTMDLKLTDKRALISGSTRGIGLAIATALAREGAWVDINGRTEASVSAALSGIRGAVANAAIEGIF